MRKALLYMGFGGVIAAIGLYLFPAGAGQELFIDYLSETSGQGYWYGVFLAMLIAGLLILLGFLLIRPTAVSVIVRNPVLLAVTVVLMFLAFWYLLPFVNGLLGGV